MPRYEFSDGSSSKFWEVVLQGDSFSVSWGRIGTAGQSQVKSFASAAKAQAEHDKLVREKIAKGYREVGGGAPPAAAVAKPAAPKPAAPVPVAAVAGQAGGTAPIVASPVAVVSGPGAAAPGVARVVWTDAGRRRVHPRFGAGFKAPKVDVKKRFAQVAGRYPELAEGWKNGEKKATRECRPLMENARVRLTAEAPRPPLVVDEEACAAVLLAAEYGPQAETFVDYWVGAAGVAFAVDALATSWWFDRLDFGTFDAPAGKLVPRDKADSEGFRYGRTHGWQALRRHLAGADPAAHAAAVEVARRHWGKAPSPLRLGLAYLFPGEDAWGRALAEEYLASKVPNYGTLLLGAVSDPSLAQRVAAAMQPYHMNTTLCETPAWEFACTLVDALGAGAVPALEQLFGMAQAAPERRAFAEALAQIASAEAAASLRPLIDDKHVRGITTDYFTRHPQLAQAALGGGSEQRGSTARVAEALLRSATAPAAAAVAEAGVAALPEVLAAPPWLAKRQAAAPAVLTDLKPPPHTERIDWRAGEQPAQADESKRDSKNVAWVRGEIDKRIQSSGNVNFFYLNRLPPAQAIERILHYAPSSWYNPEPGEILELVAAAGLDSLPALVHLCAGAPVQTLEVLTRFDSPRVAPLMADARVRLKKAKGFAETWLLQYPRAAAIGLVPDAVGRPGKSREAAGGALRWLVARGQQPVIDAVAAGFGKPAAAAVEQVLALDPLLAYPARLPKLPDFWRPAAWPAPVLRSGGALPAAAIEHLGTMLAFSTAEAPYAGLQQVKDACDPRSLSVFAWELFEAWLRAGAPSKEQWAMLALGHLGDDETARRLTPLLRAWPGESASARAVSGLEVLALIGSDLALMHLNAIAQKVKFKALQDRAQEKIGQIAEARGMTDEELADRLVPDLGLESSGSRMLDFGPRAFTVGFDEQLRPFVRDAEGGALPDLPKPLKSDDAPKAAAAADTWKALKKDARAIASDQVLRLERALAARRRWPLAAWRMLLAEHPVLMHLVRRLVWGAYQETRLISSFRVAEDGTLADVDDATYTVPEGASVGLVHPLELTAEAVQGWGRVLGEYQVLQPFPQIARRSHTIEVEETEAKAMARFEGLQVGFGSVLGLQRYGWRKAEAQDGGVSTAMRKRLVGGLTLELPLDPGLYLGDMRENGAQVLGAVVVRDALQREQTLGVLDPVAFSELVYELEGLEPA